MRQKRSKTYRKLLSTYILHYGFRPPFQLLLDATFTRSLSLLHLTPEEAGKRLSDVLQTSQLSKGKTKAGTPEMKCLITQCCMVELYNAEKEGQVDKDAVKIAKTWERRRCNHREAIPADECLKSVIGPNNKHRYILASDRRALRDHLRAEVAGLPLVHTNQSRIIVLEPMSDKTRAAIDEIERAKFAGSGTLPPASDNIVTGLPAPSPVIPATKRRRPKEANPLSNKKSKKVLEAEKAEKARRTREIEERTMQKRKEREQAATGQANGFGQAANTSKDEYSGSSKKRRTAPEGDKA